MTSVPLPHVSEPIAGTLPLSVVWRDYFQRALSAQVSAGDSATSLSLEVQALAVALGSTDGTAAGLPNPLFETTTYAGQDSVHVFGTDPKFIRLVGDDFAPGNTYYYGTGPDGAKGWHERRLDTLADVDASTPPSPGDALVFDGSAWLPGSVDSAVPYFIPDGSRYTVAANKQALFTLPIELEGDASLVVDGALIEVN